MKSHNAIHSILKGMKDTPLLEGLLPSAEKVLFTDKGISFFKGLNLKIEEEEASEEYMVMEQ